jgi:hypothetical protein
MVGTFVQMFGPGALRRTEGTDDTLLIEAQHPGGQTLFVSEAPHRSVGMMPTDDVLGGPPVERAGFTPVNPSTAILVLGGPADTDPPNDMITVELLQGA